MRSGSTFLGELFNNHDDAFHVFEPLHAFSSSGFSPKTVTQRLNLLEKNLKCNFTDTYDVTVPYAEISKDLNLHDILGTGCK